MHRYYTFQNEIGSCTYLTCFADTVLVGPEVVYKSSYCKRNGILHHVDKHDVDPKELNFASSPSSVAILHVNVAVFLQQSNLPPN